MSVFDEDVVFILIYEFTYTYIQAKKDTHILSKKKKGHAHPFMWKIFKMQEQCRRGKKIV